MSIRQRRAGGELLLEATPALSVIAEYRLAVLFIERNSDTLTPRWTPSLYVCGAERGRAVGAWSPGKPVTDIEGRDTRY